MIFAHVPWRERFRLRAVSRGWWDLVQGAGPHFWADVPRSAARDRFLSLCTQGRAAAERFADQFGLTASTFRAGFALRTACTLGQLETAMWLTDRFKLTVADIRAGHYTLQFTCANGHLAVAAWLVDRFGLGPDDINTENRYGLRYACMRGHHDMVVWIVTKFGLPTAHGAPQWPPQNRGMADRLL